MKKTKYQPLISVIVPTYNRAKIISRSLNSVLAQTYTNWELIIVDDGSIDNTKKIIQTNFSDKRISYFYIKNHGVSYARNFGCSKAKGEIISFLDSDDEYDPSKLDSQLYQMINGKTLFSLSDRIIYIEGKPKSRIASITHFLQKSEIVRNKINCSGSLMMFNREVLRKMKFDESLSFGEDLDFILRLLDNYRCIFVSKPLVIIHKTLKYDRLSTSYKSTILSSKVILRKIENNNYFLSVAESELFRNRLYWSLGISNFLSDDNKQAKLYFKKYFNNNLFSVKGLESLFLFLISQSTIISKIVITILKKLWSSCLVKT